MNKENLFIPLLLLILSNNTYSMLPRCLKSPRHLQQRKYCTKNTLFPLPKDNIFNTMPAKQERMNLFLEDIWHRNNSHLEILNKAIQTIQQQTALAATIVNDKKDFHPEEFRKLEQQISRNLNAVSHNLYYYLPPQQLLDRD